MRFWGTRMSPDLKYQKQLELENKQLKAMAMRQQREIRQLLQEKRRLKTQLQTAQNDAQRLQYMLRNTNKE